MTVEQQQTEPFPFSEDVWDKEKLGEIAKINLGQSPKSKFYNERGEEIPFAQGSKNFGNKYPTFEKFCTNPKRTAERGDVLISVRAPVGPVNIAPRRMCIGRGLTALKMKDGSNEFLYYFLKYYEDKWSQVAGGTTFGSITKIDLINLEIPFPPSQERKKVTRILSNLDDKIEANNKINQVLEEIAQTIFKSQFVDFEPYDELKDSKLLGRIPENFEVCTLEEILLKLESGSRPKGDVDKYSEGVPSVGAANVLGLGKFNFSDTKYVPEEFYSSIERGKVENGDVLLYKDGAKLGRKTLSRHGFPFKRFCVNSHVFILRANERISPEYLYFWLDRPEITEKIKNLNTGSAQPGINQKSVNSMEILLPPKSEINKFDGTVKPLIKQLFQNSLENKVLQKIRDTLLPKLMSGEIRVIEDGSG